MHVVANDIILILNYKKASLIPGEVASFVGSWSIVAATALCADGTGARFLERRCFNNMTWPAVMECNSGARSVSKEPPIIGRDELI